MYPSGVWRGFWQQDGYGRQPMDEFVLRFDAGRVTGSGRDVIGPFAFAGTCDPATGRVTLVKQYLGKHQVLYDGRPDGEGSIAGTWVAGGYTGPFLIRPVVDASARAADDEFVVITKSAGPGRGP